MIALMVGLEIVPSALAQDAEYDPPHQKPGPATERIYFQYFHVDLAAGAIQAGDMDFYQFSL
ncbi:MAG: hypothetical protein IIC27_05860, partial [Chloroflexi bacterium]|nr:hypothetical protein [Chloroflexota bacterium]